MAEGRSELRRLELGVPEIVWSGVIAAASITAAERRATEFTTRGGRSAPSWTPFASNRTAPMSLDPPRP